MGCREVQTYQIHGKCRKEQAYSIIRKGGPTEGLMYKMGAQATVGIQRNVGSVDSIDININNMHRDTTGLHDSTYRPITAESRDESNNQEGSGILTSEIQASPDCHKIL